MVSLGFTTHWYFSSPGYSLESCASAVHWNESATGRRSKIMFHNLDEQIKRSQGRAATIWNRMLQYAGVLFLSGVLFGGLYLGILFLE